MSSSELSALFCWIFGILCPVQGLCLTLSVSVCGFKQSVDSPSVIQSNIKLNQYPESYISFSKENWLVYN